MIDFMISEIRKHNGKRSYSCASYYLELEVLHFDCTLLLLSGLRAVAWSIMRWAWSIMRRLSQLCLSPIGYSNLRFKSTSFDDGNLDLSACLH